MKKYTIYVYTDNNPNAGTKLRRDLEKTAVDEGYEMLVLRKRVIEGRFKIIKQIFWLISDFIKFSIKIKRNSILLLISPLPFSDKSSKIAYYFFESLKLIKNVKITAVLIDLNKPRLKSKVYDGEFVILRNADYIIAHNDKMKKIMLEYEFDKNKIIPIGIFDNLTEHRVQNTNRELTKDIVFAGHLEPLKSGFVYQIDKLETDLFFKLYGGNYEGNKNGSNYKYMGVFSTDKIVEKLEGSFGLVWDGYSLNTCSGVIGEYLRMNNPHKTSLYITAGLPVIIWEEAALADYITEKNLGFTINSIKDIDKKIDKLSNDDYLLMLKNVKKEAQKISNGWYFKKVLREIEKKVG